MDHGTVKNSVVVIDLGGVEGAVACSTLTRRAELLVLKIGDISFGN